MRYESLDAGLVGFVPNGYDSFTPFQTPLDVEPNLDDGVGFVLFDNVWNTNYPLWYPFVDYETDSNLIFRFNVVVKLKQQTQRYDIMIGFVCICLVICLLIAFGSTKGKQIRYVILSSKDDDDPSEIKEE